MKTTLSYVVIALFILLSAACATAPTSDIKVETEAAPGADLTAYKTYAWLAAAKIVNDPAGNLVELVQFQHHTEHEHQHRPHRSQWIRCIYWLE